MWFFSTKKQVKNSIKKSSSRIKKEVSRNKELIEELKNNLVSKKEVELMIRESIVKLRESTSQTSRTKPRSKLRVLADRKLNIAEIRHEIGVLLNNGYNTADIYKEIVNIKQLCKSTCFYKYLKEIRKLGVNTSRTSNITPRSKGLK